jgi:SAM-dependent methyltransferase
VNIPLEELAARVAELPPRGVPLRVFGDPALGQSACAELTRLGRPGIAAGVAPPKSPTDNARRRLWEPNRFIADLLQARPPGCLADLGCGTGRDAVFAASCGWWVTAVDRLPDAIERAAALAQRYLATPDRIAWQVGDVEHPAFTLAETFDLLYAVRYWDVRILALAQRNLRPGGMLAIETFSVVHRERHGKPADPRRVLDPDELDKALAPLLIDSIEIAETDDAHTVRVTARQPA